MAMLGQRAGFKPIEPQNDEMMGMRNLQATSGGAINAPDQYYATQAGISGLGDAYSDRAASFARNVAADAHSGMGNTDEQQNERIQKLYERRDELEAEIRDLKAEIAWQEKLRDNEMSGDPMWEVAKQKYVQKGDSSDLESIMNRRSTEKLAKDNAKKEADDKKEANERSARFSRDYMMEILKNYDAVKADPNKRIDAGRDLIKAYQDFREKAEIAGKTETDYFKEDEVLLNQVKAAIDEARATQSTEIKKQQDANAKAKAKTAEDNTVTNIVDDFNKNSHSAIEAKAKKLELEKNYPNYTFSVSKGNKIVSKRKAGK